MKKNTHLIVILAFTITSLACQAINTLANKVGPDTPTPITTSTEIANTPTPTEPTPGTEAWIAFENQNNIWLVHPDGSGLTQITDNSVSGSGQSVLIGDLKWSPNGTTLAYAQSDQNVISISLFNIETSKTMPLLQNVGGGFDWLPNGAQIVYDTTSTGEAPIDFHNDGIWVVNVEDGKARQIVKPTSDHPILSDPQLSATESYILLTIFCFEPNCVGHDVVNYETGNFVALPAFGGECEWSPISMDIACIRTDVKNLTGSVQQEIAIFDKLGSLKQTFALPEAIPYTTLHWSPDGQNLVIGHYSDDGGQTDIVPLGNGENHMLASGIPSDWSPDGVWVLTWDSKGLGETPSMIFAVNKVSGESFPLTEGMFPVWQPVTGDAVAVVPSQADATATPILIPVETDTLTPKGPCTEVTITVRDTNKGDYLQICTNGKEYEVGPLEKGGYAVGPNQTFFVYVSNSGTVYAARIGDTRLTVLGDVKDFLFVKRDKTPQFEFQFFGDQTYTVEVHETVFNQKKLLPIPRRISAPN